MAQPTIYTIENLPNDATPEESMLCWMNMIYDNYYDLDNTQLIDSRKYMLTRLYQIRMDKNNNITDNEKRVQDQEKDQIQLDYEGSMNESARIACFHTDYKTMYLTLYELKHIYQEFQDEWMDFDSFFELFDQMTCNFLV